MREYHYEMHIMGSDMAVSIIAPDERVARRAYQAMQSIAREADQRFSRFIAESELSRLNTARSLSVSDDFMEAFLIGKRLYEETGGAFNPLADISRFGYDEDIEEVRGKDRIGAPLAPYDLAFERIRANGNIITLEEGQNLDFGGFLKGHLAERLARTAASFAGVVVNLGGDLFTLGQDEYGNPFEFFVEHPFDEHRLLSFTAEHKAIATSGSYRRHWSLHGVPFYHILDASGAKNPETDLISVTVVAPSGASADAYATAALVLGSREAARLLRAKGYDYCFIRSDGEVEASVGLSLQAEPAPTYAFI